MAIEFIDIEIMAIEIMEVEVIVVLCKRLPSSTHKIGCMPTKALIFQTKAMDCSYQTRRFDVKICIRLEISLYLLKAFPANSVQ